MKKFLYSVLLLSAFSGAQAQKAKDPKTATTAKTGEGYEIRISFKGCKDTVAYLAKYVFDKQYLVDTCKKVVKGNIIFKGKTPLDKGIYFLVSQEKGRYFDFFVNDAEKFAVSADTSDMVKSLKSPNCKENEDFFTYIKFIASKNKEFSDLKTQTKGMTSKDSAKFMSERSKQLNESVVSYEKQFMDSHKDQYIHDVINLKVEKESKDVPKASNGRPDSVWAYNYYKSHYWDNVNFGDDRILRTPFFGDKLKKYFNSVVVQNPDTINVEIDRIMKQTKQGSDMHKFLLAYFTPTYETSKMMGFDKVFVHLIETYICTGQAKGIYEEKTVDKICERGKILKPLLLGNQAPDLLMVDTTGHKAIARMGFDTVKTSAGATDLYYKNIQALAQTFISMYSVKADYFVLVFWDVDCGHCQTEIPKLLDEYHKLKGEKYDIKVFSVYTQHEYDKWHKYIIDHKLDWINVYDGVHINNIKEKYDIYSTPVIYVLDKNKYIKAKRIAHEQLSDIIKAMEREYKAPKK